VERKHGYACGLSAGFVWFENMERMWNDAGHNFRPWTFRGFFLALRMSLLCKENIVGRMWKHLRERFHVVKVRVLHPRIPERSSVDILRGVPEGSRLRPTLFGIFMADLIHKLKAQFQYATITHNGGLRWTGGILYVDNLSQCLDLNRCPRTPDDEKARMQLNAEKTKVMCFHGPLSQALSS